MVRQLPNFLDHPLPPPPRAASFTVPALPGQRRRGTVDVDVDRHHTPHTTHRRGHTLSEPGQEDEAETSVQSPGDQGLLPNGRQQRVTEHLHAPCKR
jgi:hypothetical protein